MPDVAPADQPPRYWSSLGRVFEAVDNDRQFRCTIRWRAQSHPSLASDGDTLFAARSGEDQNAVIRPKDLRTLASETVWDSVLASVSLTPSHERPAASRPVVANEFVFDIDRGDRMRRDQANDGNCIGLTINPGTWPIRATRLGGTVT